MKKRQKEEREGRKGGNILSRNVLLFYIFQYIW